MRDAGEDDDVNFEEQLKFNDVRREDEEERLADTILGGIAFAVLLAELLVIGFLM